MIKFSVRHEYLLLHVDHVKLDNKWNYKNVISPYFRIYYIDEGEGWINHANKVTRLVPGKLYIIPSFTFCHLQCDHFLSQYFVHFFEESTDGISLFECNRKVIGMDAMEVDVRNIKTLLKINPGRGINRSDDPLVYEKNAYIRSYQELNNNASMATYLETQGILLQLVARFLQSVDFITRESDPIPSKILDTISFIQINMGKELSVDLLAKRVRLHKDYFSRLFQKHTGERPLAYIHSKRIERAQYLMMTTDLSYAEISEQTGFETIQYFSKVFKKVALVTPAEYKKNKMI